VGDLLQVQARGQTHTINSVEIGSPELDTGGYKNYIWSYNSKHGQGDGTIRAVFLVSPDKEAADKLLVHTLEKRTAKHCIAGYEGGTWYARKEGPSFYDDEPVLNVCWT
jgi:hypothetical protein